MAEARAVVFDLDDTLYPYRRFVSSGFRVVADALERDHGVPARLALRTLFRARVCGGRGYELQRACRAFGLPLARAGEFRELIRRHSPTLRLPERSRQVLRLLRPGWRLGILTNGLPAIQERKVHALGVEDFVDVVVYATACGDGRGKPARDSFRAVLDRLGVRAEAAVFVGDDGPVDILGAAGAGMQTIHLVRCPRPGRNTAVVGGAMTTTLLDVPELAERLVCKGEGHVV
jgi:putative hydrolase of the HAD superfamily